MIPLESPWIPALGFALLHFLWQGALVWLGAALALRLLRQARPQARYAVACAGLLLCVALPTAGVLRALASVGPVAANAGAEPGLVGPAADFQAAGDAAPTALADVPPARSWEAALRPRLPLIVAFWAAGTALLAWWGCAGWGTRPRRCRIRSGPPGLSVWPPPWA